VDVYYASVTAPPSNHAASTSCRQFQHAVELIGRRWSGAILYEMFGGASRFTEIRDRVPGLSDRLLSQRLRELEAQGLVYREVIPDVPVQVRYTLTHSARELLPAIQILVAWGRKWLRPTRSSTTVEARAPRPASPTHRRRIRQATTRQDPVKPTVSA
jgi:DNA-binding HxlR family transcriptional regulator